MVSMMMIIVRYSKHMNKVYVHKQKEIISNNKSKRYKVERSLWEQRGSFKERADEHLLKSRFENAMIWDLINFLTNLHKVKDVLC